jgi:crossover junction endodeoxyribonuclease RuvC
MRLLGLDPGLRLTGWGIVEASPGRLSHVANGTVASDAALETAARLVQLYDGVAAVIARYAPEAAAVEETFVNKNAATTLKLGLARGVILLAPARAGLSVAEYSANLVKKSVVGAGHAGKEQIQAMVRHLLPGVEIHGPDAADALAVAICHAHHAATASRWRAAERAARVSGS